ncbi:unnamed protein product [Schistocephalus solidus]|uniref:Uncharacterized protein n=1 Tax=Schistocephalus solidus TaxID=70667 RepID=A0A183TK75_SCHSO|nr:unnamed protein product [Schistocephalus solidus]
MASTKQAREFPEAWPSGINSVNRHVDLDAHYEVRRLGTRINEHKVAIHRRDSLSLVFAHANACDHRFNWEGTEVVAMASTKQARKFLEAWHSDTDSIKRHFDLDVYFEGLRERSTDLRPS